VFSAKIRIFPFCGNPGLVEISRCGGLAGDFSMMGEELITKFPSWHKRGAPNNVAGIAHILSLGCALMERFESMVPSR